MGVCTLLHGVPTSHLPAPAPPHKQAKELSPAGPLELLAARLLYCLLLLLSNVAQVGATAGSFVCQGWPELGSAVCGWRFVPDHPAYHTPDTTHTPQMARRVGAAGAKLAVSGKAAVRPAMSAAQSTAQQLLHHLRERDLRGAAALLSDRSAASAVAAAAAVHPAITSLREAASSWSAAAAPCLSSLSACLRKGWSCGLAAAQRSAARACECARACHAALDPHARLPAALKGASSRPGAVYLLLGLGGASLAVSALLVYTFGAGANSAPPAMRMLAPAG